MSTQQQHTIHIFDEEISALRRLVISLGELTTKQLTQAQQSLPLLEKDIAVRVIAQEPEADKLEHEIEELVVRELATRQPAAVDLREILAALRIANELERVCDYAENIAERVTSLHGARIDQVPLLLPLVRFAAEMIQDVMTAYASRDVSKAQEVWSRDERLDEMYSHFCRRLLATMTQGATQIVNLTQVLLMARDIERIGDHATNIAVMVRFLLQGKLAEGERPKADFTRSIGGSPGE